MKVPGPFRPVCRSEGDDLNPIIEIVFESEDRNPTIGMTCVFAFLVSAEYILYYKLYYIILFARPPWKDDQDKYQIRCR